MSLTGAYGGEKWSPRTQSRRDEMASVWGDWGSGSECSRLQAVLLHRPGRELDEIVDFDAAQMRADIRPDVARAQHDALADAYRAEGVTVHYVEGYRPDKPNQMFCRDLMTMTPEGAILARPASTVRAGEERFVAEALGVLGVPVLMSVHGTGTFEGADAMWAAPDLCFVAEGLRTNRTGAEQVAWALGNIGVMVERVVLPYGAMHLDGMLNFAAPDLAVVWPRRTPMNVVRVLAERGVRIVHLLDEPDDARLPARQLRRPRPEPHPDADRRTPPESDLRGRGHCLHRSRCQRTHQSGRRYPLPHRLPEACGSGRSQMNRRGTEDTENAENAGR